MSYAEPDDTVEIFARHSGPLYAVACSPKEATLVASGGGDNLASLWNIGCQDRVNELKGHSDTVSCLSFSKDGQLLASGGLDACVKIWDIFGNLKCTLQGPVEGHEFEWVTWHSNARLVLAGCTDSTVWLWNADDQGALLNVFCGHGDHVTCGGFTPDENGVLSVADIASGKVTSSFSPHSSSIQSIGHSLSMPWVATGDADEKLVIWVLQHSACRNIFEYQDEITCLNWLGESMLVASGCGDGQIMICDTRSGEHVRSFKGHSDKIQQLAVSADNKFLVSGSEDATARVFDVSDFRY
uniref:Angio-associated migratory cell protein n=1 Tax=Chenopodium quinoa TaxID=63459 RepID=A0A803KRK7_CHEQI